MGLEASQRRDLIALLCRVAWADGVVVKAERDRLHDVLVRVGQGVVRAEELESWLLEGPPRVERTLPLEAKQVFIHEALALISVDNDVDPAEMTAMRDVINYYFTRLDELMVG